MRSARFQRLREEAIRCLATTPPDTSKWGTDVANLLEELSIYHIELEHQAEEARRAYEEMLASRDAWEDLFQNAPLAYVILDDKLIIQQWNKPFASLFHQANCDRYGVAESFTRYVAPTHQDAFARFARMLGSESLTAGTELVMLNKFGKPTHVKLNAVSNIVKHSIRFAISDMTIQKQLEAKLRQIQDKQEGTAS